MNSDEIMSMSSDDVELQKMRDEVSSLGVNEQFAVLIKSAYSLVNRFINKPTVREKIFPTIFKLTKNHIENLYSLIAQKLDLYKIENPEFEIKVLYNEEDDNKSSVKFDNIETFMSTNNTKPVCAKMLTMSWNTKLYLENAKNPLQKIIGEEFRIEIAISAAPSNEADEAYFIFNDYPIKTKGIIQVSVMHSNQIIADEIIQHINNFVKTIEEKSNTGNEFIVEHRRQIAQLSEKIISLTAFIPLALVFFNFNDCLNEKTIFIRLLCLSFFFFIISNLFSEYFGAIIYKTLGRKKTSAWIILNDYTQKLYDEEIKKRGNWKKIFFLLVLPILINLVSAFISWKLGIGK